MSIYEIIRLHLWIVHYFVRNYNKIMSRSGAPSLMQQEMLLETLEEKRWLATGYARTCHARERTRAAWQGISQKLNSDGSGCIKTWQQWAKYWQDKKSAVKKKYSQMRLARQQTGGGAAREEIALSSIEERIAALLGGEQFVIGDREHEINPFHEAVLEPAPCTTQTQETNQPNIEDRDNTTNTSVSESILQPYYAESLVVEQGSPNMCTMAMNTTEYPVIPIVEICELPPPPLLPTEPSGAYLYAADSHVPPATGTNAQPASSATSSPHHRRRLTGRRRLVGRSPPSQRHSQMAMLTERFIALEEQRNATEQLQAQNQQRLVDVLERMSEAWLRQSQAMQDLVNRINIAN